MGHVGSCLHIVIFCCLTLPAVQVCAGICTEKLQDTAGQPGTASYRGCRLPAKQNGTSICSEATDSQRRMLFSLAGELPPATGRRSQEAPGCWLWPHFASCAGQHRHLQESNQQIREQLGLTSPECCMWLTAAGGKSRHLYVCSLCQLCRSAPAAEAKQHRV